MYGLEFAGVDDAFAAAEATTAAAGVERVAPGLAVAGAVDRARARGLGYTRRAVDLVGRTTADVASARAVAEAAPLGDRTGTVAVRARDVRGATGASTAAAERAVGAALVDRGFDVDLDDPDHVLRVLFAGPDADGRRATTAGDDGSTAPPGADGHDGGGVDPAPGAAPDSTPDASPATDSGPALDSTPDRDRDRDPDPGRTIESAPEAVVQVPAGSVPAEGVCLLGWTAVEPVRDFARRRPTDRPFFQPGSMAPADARAVANLAGAGPDATLLDPMCGTGGVLIEAGLVGARVLGVDAQARMVRGARENCRAYLDAPGAGPAAGTVAVAAPGPHDVARGDATVLPLRDDAVDGVAFDAPYGRQSKVERHDLAALRAGALAEAARVAPRAVVIADRSLRTATLDAGWRLRGLYPRPVHRSLVRYVHVLERA